MSIMQVSRKVDYALRAAIYLAYQNDRRPCSVAEIAARLLAESRMEAATLVRQIERTLGESGALLEPGEEGAIRAAIATLQAGIAGTDYNRIRDLAQSLSDVSTPFAHRIMEASIKRALEHKSAGGGPWA